MYDVENIRADFPVLKDNIYLDNAATTQTPVQAVRAMEDYFFKYAANHGRGAHHLARQTTDHFEDARETIADLLNCPAENTIFTKNATEGLNLIARGIDWQEGDHIVTTLVEHHSDLLPWMELRERGVELTIVEPDNEGHVAVEALEQHIRPSTRLLAVTHISNSFGSIQDADNMCKLARDHDNLCLIDGSQSAGHMPVNLKQMDCDFFVAPGHKGLLGPQGTGVAYIKEPDSIKPLNVGGGAVRSVTTTGYELEETPARFEAGTPNIPGGIGLGRAVKYVQEIGVSDIEKHERQLAKNAAYRLAQIEGVEVYGPDNRGAVVPFNVRGLNPHDVAMILDETRQICLRSGYHCAMPGIDFMKLKGTVRASFALYNTEEEVDALVETVEQITTLA
ncbi:MULTISPECIES: aminotransferase class V-fold PLP-dependent enzyme [Methanohalophilus]|uniref:cysteine desulfurase n=1 Tax=Methanohalophilus euhalobius TaxID=51203 RepID=A0A285G088_9EURY|nr:MULTISPECIES: cysteine desulfurase [Methanohalophilus]RSD36263.1 MAG: aminotransferase class V [Methanohalophilus sp.]ODV50274.1 MAG: aminotransferase class V [Methanohalophilus sp. 2-GBenrich]PQV42799.1 cysteine desulfurase/selenocysteine lyase [Methanohalophilus euhalobius]RNI10523.1 cysteine desulfurase [Methanohalophilus euhalobius]RXG34099.1 aminotransferase class V [Methanohalophilus sp. WG1-DM]